MRVPLVLPLLLAIPACGPAGGPDAAPDPLAVLGEKRGEWEDAETGADRAMALGRWEEAAALFERKISLAPSARTGEDPRGGVLGTLVGRDFYNLACCRAQAGRTDAAQDALDQAVGEGFAIVGFDHLVEDPDLAPLRGRPRWEALVRRLSWNEEVALLPDPSPGEGKGARAALVEIRGKGAAEAGERGVAGAVTVLPAPPYRESRTRRGWTTRLDPGERAAEKAAYALGRAAEAGGTDPERRILLARGEEEVRIAWEVLLRRPEAFTRAVLAGPAPPAWLLLDRGAERIRAEILVAGPDGLPPSGVRARVRDCGTESAALREALR